MKNITFILFTLFLNLPYFLQCQEVPHPTSAEERSIGFERRLAAMKNSLVGALPFQSIGPTIMGGRVTDVEVSPYDINEFYVAYASGGLFHTKNNGQSYNPLFDHEVVMSIGDIAVDWENDRIWVGTGENNSSRSSYSGFGMYLSEDGGKSWEHRGLEESHHIGRVILHPGDPNTLWVAVIGHLYSPSEERGVYKSTDAGKTWKKVLYIDENSGAIDLVIHPENPNVLYAAIWHRQRRAWNFIESGQQSGIYRSSDGGESWELKSGDGSGFAMGEGIGRIGLAMSSKGKVVYAIVDNQNRRPEKEITRKGLQKEELREMTKEDFAEVDDNELKKYLNKFGFPKELTADSLYKMVANNEINPHHLVDYVEDANRNLFDTEVVGAEVYAAYDGADYWVRTHEKYLDDLVYTYGYYFGQIRVSPNNREKFYIVGVPILKSEDGGKTFESINGDNQHVDHHALWVSDKHDGHLINGNDGGINISYDDGKNWLKVKSPPVGQFYTVNVDYKKRYNVYGGLQDNGVWYGPSDYSEGVAWEGTGNYPYKRILGGDGFQIAIDRRDNKTVYTGFQFGHYFRFNRYGGKKKKVTPRHELGEHPLRFNWQTPIHLSKHNQDVFYIGSNKFHRSLDRGDSYDFTSRDLTYGGKKGDVAFGTLTSIHESPLKFGLIYVGTDDGNVYRSDDLGYHWVNLNEGLPNDLWVSRIQASAHDTSRVYLALNGYRWDNFDAYVYVSDDLGKNWKKIGQNLPLEPVNVIKEDPVNEDLLYVGTDHGLYISLDRGDHFHYANELPAVAVHDLVVHEREHEVVVGTHGRSLYKAGLGELQKMDTEILQKSIHLFEVSSVKYNEKWGKKMNNWKEAREPKLIVPVYVKQPGIASVSIWYKGKPISGSYGMDTVRTGINYLEVDLSVSEVWIDKAKKLYVNSDDELKLEKAENGKYYLLPGKYETSVSGSPGFELSKRATHISNNRKFEIKDDKK